VGKAMTQIGNQEIITVPMNMATNAGKTECMTSFNDLLKTALAK
jgi:hypothetical protein